MNPVGAEPVPDYGGGGIANLMASLEAGLGHGRSPLPPCTLLDPAEVARARVVVLWVVDGLGDRYLQTHGSPLGLLAQRRGPLTSVFPTTTASAVSTFLTGYPPARHGVTGWHVYLRELGAVVAVLPGRTRFGASVYGDTGVAVTDLFPAAPFTDRLATAGWLVSPAAIAGSPFNRAHQGRAGLHAFDDLTGLVEGIRALARGARERTFIYAYWSGLDHLGHQEGMTSPAGLAHLRELERAYGTLRTELAGRDALLLVSADHGQVEAEGWVSLWEHPTLERHLALPLSGEPRAAYCHVRPGSQEPFRQAVADCVGERGRLYPSAELVERGWFGPGPEHPRLRDRIGDYALVMNGRWAVRDRVVGEGGFTPVGVHGGLSAEELYVPLCVGHC